MAAKSGDVCPNCKTGKLLVASSQRQGMYQIRYLRCRCGNTDKDIRSAAEIRRVKAG
jgi:hypothetical protein